MSDVHEKKRILVLEDEPEIFQCLEAALADEGYDVAWAAHGGIALETIPHYLPDVIVTDLVMPVMDGEAFLRAYRASPPPHVPVILLTASHIGSNRISVMAPDAVVGKPYLIDDVVAAIESCLRGAAAGRGASRRTTQASTAVPAPTAPGGIRAACA